MTKFRSTRFAGSVVAIAVIIASAGGAMAQTPSTAPADETTGKLERLKYNNPGLVVDIGVGLWGIALPMDYDGDGKPELLMGWGGRPYSGVMLFEREGGDDSLLHKPGRLVSKYVTDLQSSEVNGEWFVTSRDKYYPDFRKTGLEKPRKLPFKPEFYTPNKFNLWRLYDYDSDGAADLIISPYDGRDYGWDAAFDSTGKWQNGRQRAPLFWVKNLGTTEKPKFAEAQPLLADGKPMEVYGLPSPNFADFDGDGLCDIISGDGLDFLTFFKNIGTKSEPRFAAGKPLTHNGQIIRMDLEMITPAAMDYDGDGDMDLVVGEEDGRVVLVRNTGKSAGGVPAFEPPVFLQQPAVELKFGALSTPYGFDFDGDGDTDIISGNTAGYVGWFENLGGQPIKWAPVRLIEADGKVIRIQAGENGSIQGPAEGKWGYTSVCVADWDHDQLPDLIVTSIWSNVEWYRNIGTRAAPAFAAAKAIDVAWPGATPKPEWNWWNPKGKELLTQWRSSVHATDLTGDGLLDMVALDVDGYLALYERVKQGDELKLLPGKRVFHVEPGAPNAFDGAHAAMTSDENNDGLNDQGGVDAQGRLGFHYRVPGTPGVSIKWLPRTPGSLEDGGGHTALRLNSGWAGRSGRRTFVMTDWDLDGKIDLLVNSYNTNFFKNVSTEPGKFTFRDMGRVDGLRLAGHNTCPAIVDFDQDRRPDLLIGAEDGFFYYLPNPAASSR